MRTRNACNVLLIVLTREGYLLEIVEVCSYCWWWVTMLASSAKGSRFGVRGGCLKVRWRAGASGQALVTLSPSQKANYKEIDEIRPELNAAAPSDFYQLLCLDVGASREDVRAKYKSLLKVVHPDVVGSVANDLAILLNKACEVLLSENGLKDLYDREVEEFRRVDGGFDGRAVSGWMGKEDETRAVFIDETVCIGCRNCTNCAPSTFMMEDLWGRARVEYQWGDCEDDIDEAISTCPVDCIYVVKRTQLALLEYVMKNCEREDIAIVARRRSGNMGPAAASENPFQQAETFLKNRSEASIGNIGQNWSTGTIQDEYLAAAIAKAWLQLPSSVRSQYWDSSVYTG